MTLLPLVIILIVVIKEVKRWQEKLTLLYTIITTRYERGYYIGIVWISL